MRKEAWSPYTKNGVEIKDNLGIAQVPINILPHSSIKGKSIYEDNDKISVGNEDMLTEITTSEVEVKFVLSALIKLVDQFQSPPQNLERICSCSKKATPGAHLIWGAYL